MPTLSRREVQICLFARPNLAPGGDIGAYLEIARMADRAGFFSIAFGEHLVIGEDTSRYPFGPWVHGLDSAWHDPLITLAAVAAVTQRIRLSTGILIASLRPALVLAKEVATLDVVSRGRVEIGLGTGWQQEEYVGVGLTWKQRQQRFDEVIEGCRAAWGPQPFALTVDGTELSGLRAYPVPVQERIPLLYGMQANEVNARRIARLGDGWTPVAVTTDQVRAGVDLIGAEYERAGRDPATLIVRVGLPPYVTAAGELDVPRMFETAPELIDAGVTQLAVSFNQRLTSLAQASEFVDAVAETARRLTPSPRQVPARTKETAR